jgi:CRISPR-associated protein Cmr6
MKNLNLLFNKSYYKALHPDKSQKELDNAFKNVNDQMFQAVFLHDRDYKALPVAKHTFLLKTAYPGLLIGIGNNHGSGESPEDIAVGFSFDYTSGQPYIPGSSVKGILRSHFKDRPEAVGALSGRTVQQVKTLEKEIFEGEDVFFDTVVYDGDEYGHLIGSEYITPHPDPMQNPIPVHLIKVLPDVRFEFRFQLCDSAEMTAIEKKDLFYKLLVTFGVGAKTNVGFGILLPDDGKKPSVPPKTVQKEWPQGKKVSNNSPRTGAKTINKIKCPHCDTINYRCKPNSTEQWPSWPKCRNKECGKDLL